MSSTPKPDFCGVLSESKRIINANSRHFIALALLFILPTTLYRTLQQHLLHESKTLTITCIYIIFVLILSLCAAGTITYSVLHGFYGRPVKLVSSIKSVSNSFLPLLVTKITSQLVVSLIVGVFMSLVIIGIVFLGGEFSYNSAYFIGLCVVGSVFLVVGMVYLRMNWVIASVVVVAESSWGLKPLRRSTNLVRGMRGVALSLLLYFGFLSGFLEWSGSAMAAWLGGGSNGWRSWAFVAQIVLTSALGTMMMLHSIAASTVLYIYSKAMHGELASEIDYREYISLPFDDDEKVHLVSVT